MIEGQQGLTWPRWQRLAAEVDGLGFAGLFRSDRFTDPRPPDRDALEMVVSLAYLAAQTKHIHFGPLVAPVSFRDPIQMARHAIALDQWSGGRMILGLGAGWQEREHTMFGYEIGDVKARMDRLEEAMEVVYRLLRGGEPVTYNGRYYHLHEAHLMPRSEHGPRLLIGGNGPKRTLPLTARYADIWNGVGLSPDRFRELNQVLDEQLREIGRPTGDVRRTVMTVLAFGKDDAALEAKLDSMRGMLPADAPASTQEQLKLWRDRRAVAGTPESVLEQIRAYAAADVEEIMFQWLDMDDIDGLRALASTVLPAL
jgi:alkanesulfonate monooxygenase SsuD/methylene tetrahydromethanopterin reductase-like flavin-dependent oxidoreductase (luciferase family)